MSPSATYVAAATYGAAAVASVLWGLTPAATKLAVGEIDPLTVGVLRTLLATCIVLPAGILLRLPLPRKSTEWRLLVYSSVGGFVAFPLLFGLGVASTTTAHAALILALLPVFTGLFGAIADRRPPGRNWWIGATVAMVGEVVLIGTRFGYDDPGVTLEGDLMCVLACIAASWGYVTGSRVEPSIGTWSTTIWGLSIGGVVLLPVLGFNLDATQWEAVTAVGWGSFAYLVIFPTVLAYVAWYWALARGGTERIGSTQFAQPVVALAAAVVVMGENFIPPLALAAVAILAGIVIAQRK